MPCKGGPIMKRSMYHGLLFCMAWCAICSANPVQIPQTPLTEIYVVNDNNWTVEVDCRKFTLLKRPCQTDTFTLFCSQTNAIPPITSMQMCVGHETVDSNGIALLTAQQFPMVKLTKGWYLTLGLNSRVAAPTVWQAWIPDTLQRPFSIINSYITHSCCTMDYVDNFCYGCAEITYVPSTCPSIGTFNDSAFCTVTGQVLGSDSLPLNGIKLICTNYGNVMTDRNGIYHLYNLDNCHAYAVRFTDLNGTQISDTVVGPLTIIIGRTITVNIRLNYKFPTFVTSSEKTNASPNKIRFLQTGTGQRIVLSVMETSAGRGTIELFSANGKCVRSLPVDFDKSGTYTINWDGRDDRHVPVGTGKYGCRVRINGETVCTGYIKK